MAVYIFYVQVDAKYTSAAGGGFVGNAVRPKVLFVWHRKKGIPAGRWFPGFGLCSCVLLNDAGMQTNVSSQIRNLEPGGRQIDGLRRPETSCDVVRQYY